MPTTKTPKRKRCRNCEELFPPDKVVDGLCEDCDSEYAYCAICKEQSHRDSLCRHVFSCEATDWDWRGAGAYEGDWPDHKESFFAVLDKTGLAVELRQAIEAGTLETFYHGSMLGPSSYSCWAGNGESRGEYGDRFTEDLTRDEEFEMTLGVGWLDSIQYGDSPIRTKARELTIAWIDEWLSMPLRRVGSGFGAAASWWQQKKTHAERWPRPPVVYLPSLPQQDSR